MMTKSIGKIGLLSFIGQAAILGSAITAKAQIITNSFDWAANYAAAGTFNTGDNDGYGFGPWNIVPGNGQQSLTQDDSAAYGLYAFTLADSAANDSITATRPCSILAGDTFSLRFRLNHLDSSSDTNGFELQDASGNVLFSFYHKGGDNGNGWFIDANGLGTATNFTYNFSAFSVFAFTLNSATTYTFADTTTGAHFNGTLSGAAIAQVTFFRANGASATSDGQNFDFNYLAITSIGAKPVPIVQPTNVAAMAGSTITLNTSFTGNPAYRWYFNNVLIPGATGTNLVLANVGVTNAGPYYVVASNATGSTTSDVAIVSVIPFGYTNAYDVAANYPPGSPITGNQGYGFAPWVVSDVGGGTYISGDNPPLFGIWNNTPGEMTTANRSFSWPVLAGQTPSLPVGGSFLIQLYNTGLNTSDDMDGLELQDANGNVLFEYYHQGGDNNDGWYMDAAGTQTATGFAYDFMQLDSFAFTLNSSTSYTFTDLSTGASFTGTLSGAPITQFTLVRANSNAAPPNGQDFKFNSPTVLSPTGLPPIFSVQPQYNGGLVGSTISLSGTAISAVGAVTYQWYFGTQMIAGATNNTLVLTNLSLAEAGFYTLDAANVSGTTPSIPARVTPYVENDRLLVYEGFNYTGGITPIDDVSQDGGLGWSGAWTNVSGFQNEIVDDSLVAVTNAPAGYDALSTGNSYYNYGNSRAGRWLDLSTNGAFAARGYLDQFGNIGAAGKTLYISFLMQPAYTYKFYEFEFHRASLDDPGRIAGVGNDTGTNDVFFREPNGTFADLGPGDSLNDTSVGNLAVDFYVVRIDYQPGHADNVRVYRNPTSLTEPATATVSVTNVGNMSFNGISLGAFGNNVGIDEIRLGAAWADVLGLPGSIGMMRPFKQAGTWAITFAGNPAFTYRVQRATVLTGPWTDVGIATPSESGIGSFTDTAPPAGQAFYRVVTP